MASNQRSKDARLLVELPQMAGEGLEPFIQHAGQLARSLGRAAGDGAHLVDVRLEVAQALFGFRPFGDEFGERALSFAEVFSRVARCKIAPGIEIETGQNAFRSRRDAISARARKNHNGLDNDDVD